MTLTPERIKELCDRHLRVVGAGYVRPQDAEAFARAIEAEVRKDDEALIERLRDSCATGLDPETAYLAADALEAQAREIEELRKDADIDKIKNILYK